MSWERTELDWLIERWETEATPWSRPTLLEWLRYVDGCVLRGVRYHVPQRCCARVKEIAWSGAAPGRRLVHDVSGCGEEVARKLLARPEEWRDPHRQELVEDPRVVEIRRLRAENEALRAGILPPDSRGAPAALPPHGEVTGVGPIDGSRGAPAALPPDSRSRVSSARVHREPLDQDQDPSPRASQPEQVPLPPPSTPVGEKSRPTIADPPPPPKVVRVAGVDVPDELTALLDRLEVPRCAMPAEAIVNAFGVYTTTELLALPARSFDFGGASKLALRNRLRDYLPSRWGPGVVLGALAPADPDPPGRGPPRTGRRGEGLAAQLVASMAARQRQRDGAPDGDRVVNADYEEVE